MTQGIYKITGLNNRCYIGYSTNIEQRWLIHLSHLQQGTHHSWKLQAVYNKYGIGILKFSIVEIVSDRKQLKIREDFYIRQNWTNCYNIKSASDTYYLDSLVAVPAFDRKKLKPYSRGHVYIPENLGHKSNVSLQTGDKDLMKSYKGRTIIAPYGKYFGVPGTIAYIKRKLIFVDYPNEVRITFPFSDVADQLLVDRA